MSYPLYRSIPEKHLVIILLSKLQKCTKNNLYHNSYRNTVLLRYVFCMGVYLHFQKWQSFPQGRDVFYSNVNLKIQLTQSTHPTHISPHIINCVKISHNSPKSPKTISTPTSIKSTNHKPK